MNGQAPNQNGSTPGTPVTPGGKPSVLLDDPIFSAIHDALQMGWSIIELKSRLACRSDECQYLRPRAGQPR